MFPNRFKSCMVCSGDMKIKASDYSFEWGTLKCWSSNLTPDLESENLGNNVDADEIDIEHLELVRVKTF